MTTASLCKNLRVAVVGASIGGLCVANVLRQLGVDVQVYELFPEGFHHRGGALGSVDVELLRRIRGDSSTSRYQHIRDHGHFYGDLWTFLYAGLPEESVHFGVDVEELIAPESNTPELLVRGKLIPFSLIIGADGGKSTIRPYVTDRLPSYSGYTLWRGLVSTKGIPGPPNGQRSVSGFHYKTLGFPCAGPDDEGTLLNCGVYMAMPESEVAVPTRNRQVGEGAMKQIPAWFVPFTRALFGDRNADFWAACVRQGKVSAHPIWEFAADPVARGRIALLGDAAHLASPRTGAGAYTAMVDEVTLGAAIEQAVTIEQALHLYNDNTVLRGAQLFQRSRLAAREFAPSGRQIPSPQQVLLSVTSTENMSSRVVDPLPNFARSDLPATALRADRGSKN